MPPSLRLNLTLPTLIFANKQGEMLAKPRPIYPLPQEGYLPDIQKQWDAKIAQLMQLTRQIPQSRSIHSKEKSL